MENQNSVCYVARVNEIKPVPGADILEQAVVGGWNCIIKKGVYNVGDLVVVATTDAVIPQELSDAMSVTNYLRKGGRVRTVKLRGVYSECLIIPFMYADVSTKKSLDEGADCMDILGIYKYEPPAIQVQLAGGRKIKYHQNPNFGIYYKFPNIKNVKGMFTEEDVVEITRKVHGTNARYGIVRKNKLTLWDKVKRFFGNKWVEFQYVYGSHNVEKGSDSQGFYDTDVWKTIAEKYAIRELLWEFFKSGKYSLDLGSGIVIYGEIYGAGIQKNYDYGLKGIEFVGFDVTMDGNYCDVSTKLNILKYELNLPVTPILYEGNWSQEIQDKFTFNNYIDGTKVPHEGIVIKHVSGDRHKVAKVINPEYTMYSEKYEIGDSH